MTRLRRSLCAAARLLAVASLSAADALADAPASPAPNAECNAAAPRELVTESIRLHELGEQARERDDWATALTFYRQSQKLDPSAPTQARIGECLERQGALIAALEAYRAGLPLVCRLGSEVQADAAAGLSELAHAIEERLPQVFRRVVGAAFEHTLELDQRLLEGAEPVAPFALDPGSHTLRSSAEGYLETQCAFQIAERERVEIRLSRAQPGATSNNCQREGNVLRVTLLPRLNSDLPLAAAAEPEPASAARRVLGFSLAGAGTLGLGLGAYFGLHTLSLVSRADCDANNECSVQGTKTIHSARRSQTAGFVAGGVGVGLLAAGIAALLLPSAGARRPDSAAARAGLEISFSQDRVEMSASW